MCFSLAYHGHHCRLHVGLLLRIMGVCCEGWVEETRGTTKLVVDWVVMCDPIERLTVGRNLGRAGRCMLMIHRFRPIYIVFFH